MPIAEVEGPLFRPNTFMVRQQGEEIARITKQWSGLLREGFTDADAFRVEFFGQARDQNTCLLILATAFSIDLDFFESRGRGVDI